MQKMADDVKLQIQQKVFALIKDGMSLKQASTFVNRHPTTVGEIMRNYQPYVEWRITQHSYGDELHSKERGYYLNVGQTTLPRGYVTTDQVNLFKSVVRLNETIYYDTTDYGLPLSGVLVKKYPYMGLLEVNGFLTGIPWTWLTIMNRRRIEA